MRIAISSTSPPSRVATISFDSKIVNNFIYFILKIRLALATGPAQGESWLHGLHSSLRLDACALQKIVAARSLAIQSPSPEQVA